MQKLKELLIEPDWAFPPDFPKNEAFKNWKDELYKKDWVVYTKKPFDGVKKIMNFCGVLVSIFHRMSLGKCEALDLSLMPAKPRVLKLHVKHYM